MTSPFPKAQARHFGEPEVATRSYTYVLPSWAQGCGGCVALPPSGVLLFWRFGTVVLQRGAAGQAKPAWQAKPVAAGTSWSSCAAATRRISCSAVTGTRHDRTPPGTGGRSRPVAAGVGDRAGPQRAGDVARHARLDPQAAQDYGGIVEVIVADGSDNAATRDLLRSRFPGVGRVPNPGGTIPWGLNRALRRAFDAAPGLSRPSGVYAAAHRVDAWVHRRRCSPTGSSTPCHNGASDTSIFFPTAGPDLITQ